MEMPYTVTDIPEADMRWILPTIFSDVVNMFISVNLIDEDNVENERCDPTLVNVYLLASRTLLKLSFLCEFIWLTMSVPDKLAFFFFKRLLTWEDRQVAILFISVNPQGSFQAAA